MVPLKTQYAPNERLEFLFYIRNVTPPHEERPIVIDGALAYPGNIGI